MKKVGVGAGPWGSERQGESAELHMINLMFEEEKNREQPLCSQMSAFYQAVVELMKVHPVCDFITSAEEVMVLLLVFERRISEKLPT